MSSSSTTSLHIGEPFSSGRSRCSLLTIRNPQKVIRFWRFLKRNDVRALFFVLSLVHFFLASEVFFYTLGDTPASLLGHPELASWERRWRYMKAMHPVVSSLVIECSIVLQFTAVYAAARNRPKLLFAYMCSSALFGVLLFTVGFFGALYHYLYGFQAHHNQQSISLKEDFTTHHVLILFTALGITSSLLGLLHHLAGRLYWEALRKRQRDEELFGSRQRLDRLPPPPHSERKLPSSMVAVPMESSLAGADAISIHFD